VKEKLDQGQKHLVGGGGGGTLDGVARIKVIRIRRENRSSQKEKANGFLRNKEGEERFSKTKMVSLGQPRNKVMKTRESGSREKTTTGWAPKERKILSMQKTKAERWNSALLKREVSC